MSRAIEVRGFGGSDLSDVTSCMIGVGDSRLSSLVGRRRGSVQASGRLPGIFVDEPEEGVEFSQFTPQLALLVDKIPVIIRVFLEGEEILGWGNGAKYFDIAIDLFDLFPGGLDEGLGENQPIDESDGFGGHAFPLESLLALGLAELPGDMTSSVEIPEQIGAGPDLAGVKEPFGAEGSLIDGRTADEEVEFGPIAQFDAGQLGASCFEFNGQQFELQVSDAVGVGKGDRILIVAQVWEAVGFEDPPGAVTAQEGGSPLLESFGLAFGVDFAEFDFGEHELAGEGIDFADGGGGGALGLQVRGIGLNFLSLEEDLVKFDGLFPFSESGGGFGTDLKEPGYIEAGIEAEQTGNIEKAVGAKGDIVEGGGTKIIQFLGHAGSEVQCGGEVAEDLADGFLAVGDFDTGLAKF